MFAKVCVQNNSFFERGRKHYRRAAVTFVPGRTPQTRRSHRQFGRGDGLRLRAGRLAPAAELATPRISATGEQKEDSVERS